MRRTIVVGNIVVDTRAATIKVTTIIIRHCLPFPLGRQSIAVVVAKSSCAIPADISYWMIFKAAVNREYATAIVYPCRSAVNCSIVSSPRTRKLIIQFINKICPAVRATCSIYSIISCIIILNYNFRFIEKGYCEGGRDDRNYQR